jgi:probable phosphoglycerate mutase
MAARKTVYFVRHGETALNRDGDRFCGVLDPELTERGLEQARAAAGRLAALLPAPELGFVSPLRRARQTSEQMKFVARWEVVDDLRELSFGEWEGLTKEEARSRTPDDFAAWDEDAYENPPPAGECGKDAAPRIGRVAERILQSDAGAVVVVAHRTYLRLFVGLLIGIPPALIRKSLDTQTGKVGELELRQDGSALLKALNT